jgi:hypothetical protein
VLTNGRSPRRYELWISLDEGGSAAAPAFPSSQWIRVYGGAHDAVQDSAAFLTFPNSTGLQSLVTWDWSRAFLCVTACDAEDRCSGCSEPMRTVLDPLRPPRNHSACAAARDFITVRDNSGFASVVAYYLTSLPLPGLYWTVMWACAALSIAAALALSSMATYALRAAIAGKLRAAFQAMACEPSGSAAALDGPDFLAAFTPSLSAVETLLIVHAIAYLRLDVGPDVFSGWPAQAIVAWGAASFPALFMLAGFNLTMGHQGRMDRLNTQQGSDVSTSRSALVERITPRGTY